MDLRSFWILAGSDIRACMRIFPLEECLAMERESGASLSRIS